MAQQSMAADMVNALFPLLEQYRRAWGDSEAGHKNTLDLLRAIKAGEVDLDRLFVTDDGWELMPKEDEDDGGSNGTFAGSLAETSPVG